MNKQKIQEIKDAATKDSKNKLIVALCDALLEEPVSADVPLSLYRCSCECGDTQ